MTEPVAPESPKPRGRASLKDMIPLRTYVLDEQTPSAIQFSRHMLRFSGLKAFSAGVDLLWGVQGTTSLNKADSFASRDAAHLRKRVYQVELLYRLSGLPPAGSSVTEEFARESGYLHFSRMSSGFRKILRDRMLTWLAEAEDAGRDELSTLDFEDLVKQRPMLVHQLMGEDRHIKAVIHPVLLPGNVSLRIATVRNIPENIEKVYTRFYEEIKTTV